MLIIIIIIILKNGLVAATTTTIMTASKLNTGLEVNTAALGIKILEDSNYQNVYNVLCTWYW
jgi:hypothetical protein